jgi:hypothetical protein
MDPDFWLFMAVGFAAQLVDGALGMAYGVISSTVLLAFGVPPAQASAAVHAAEVFTTGASGASHMAHRNVDWKLFRRLAPAGAAGAVLGAYVLTSVDGDAIRPFVTGYLAILGVLILLKALGPPARPRQPGLEVVPLGAVGGFLDASGGGGWGPIVTSSLVASGQAPRTTIGTVNTVEFVVATTASAAFLIAMLSGHWEEAEGVVDHVWSVAGLIAGGLIAAPFAGYLTKLIPTRTLMILVGVLVLGLAGFQTVKALGWI